MKELLVLFPYLLFSFWLTFRIGNNLHQHGRHWVFHLLKDEHLSDKINDLLLLGYRLLNIGYVLLTLMTGRLPGFEASPIIEFYSGKLGIIIMILAWLHYQNIFLLILFSKLKTKYKWQL